MRGERHLARVGVDGADVELAVGPLQDDLLHIDPDLLHLLAPNLEVDELQELLDVAQ